MIDDGVPNVLPRQLSFAPTAAEQIPLDGVVLTSIGRALVRHEVEIRQHSEVIEVRFRNETIEVMERLRGDSDHSIDNRESFWPLVREAGAFARDHYCEDLLRLRLWRTPRGGERFDYAMLKSLAQSRWNKAEAAHGGAPDCVRAYLPSTPSSLSE